jgi:hypothetical protein
MLDTPQIKMCGQQKGDIVPKHVSKLTYEKQPSLIYTKPADECNTYCKEYLTAQYIETDFVIGLLKRKWTHVVIGRGEVLTQKADVGFEIPVAYYVKEAFSIMKKLGLTNRTGGDGDADTKFRIQLLNAKWEVFSNRFIEMRQEAHIIPLLDISYSMRNMDDETYCTAIGFAILFSQISVLGKRILTIDNLPNWINLEKAKTFFEMVETFCVSTKSSGSTVPNFFRAIDLIVYSIQNTNIDISATEEAMHAIQDLMVSQEEAEKKLQQKDIVLWNPFYRNFMPNGMGRSNIFFLKPFKIRRSLF